MHVFLDGIYVFGQSQQHHLEWEGKWDETLVENIFNMDQEIYTQTWTLVHNRGKSRMVTG
jgi:hypothetical protein